MMAMLEVFTLRRKGFSDVSVDQGHCIFKMDVEVTGRKECVNYIGTFGGILTNEI
jgi:hypothetical protein